MYDIIYIYICICYPAILRIYILWFVFIVICFSVNVIKGKRKIHPTGYKSCNKAFGLHISFLNHHKEPC